MCWRVWLGCCSSSLDCDGLFTYMDTPYTMRAKQLRDIYSSLTSYHNCQDHCQGTPLNISLYSTASVEYWLHCSSNTVSHHYSTQRWPNTSKCLRTCLSSHHNMDLWSKINECINTFIWVITVFVILFDELLYWWNLVGWYLIVQEHDCKLTREIVELIEREADLLVRGIKKDALSGNDPPPFFPPLSLTLYPLYTIPTLLSPVLSPHPPTLLSSVQLLFPPPIYPSFPPHSSYRPSSPSLPLSLPLLPSQPYVNNYSCRTAQEVGYIVLPIL